ncbi:MAG: hypothetical protein IK093_12190 [Ruminiclostridium sp.]|nr:hypothetical protein [Ruminiclostridium sp.]
MPDNNSASGNTPSGLVSIDGATLPGIYSYKIDLEDIDGAESGRSETGVMHRNVLRSRVKKVYVGMKLSDEQMSEIGNIIEQGTSLEMSVRVPGGGDEAGTFYISKLSATMMKLADDSWWELSFNAIEE